MPSSIRCWREIYAELATGAGLRAPRSIRAIEETISAIAALVNESYVRHVNLSEVGPKSIRIADLQIRILALQPPA